jgi:hypothetical protein
MIRLLWVACVLVLVSHQARAQTVIFTASLDGAQEVPSNGSGGTGSGTLNFNSTTRDWTLSGTFTGLTGTTNNAHIHGPAAPGVSAGVVTGITYTTGATSGTFSGAGTFSVSQANDLLAGLYYINIHTSAFGGGEIRGQLTAVPEPSTYALGAGGVVLAAAGLLRARRRGARVQLG